CSGERPGERDSSLPPQLPAEPVDELTRRQAVIPDIEMALVREAAHALAVFAHAGADDLPALLRRQPDIAPGDLDARRHALDVPLPWTGQRLIEVVRAEDEPAVRRREAAEVRDVRVPAGLHDDAG